LVAEARSTPLGRVHRVRHPSYTLTVRSGATVDKERHESIREALDAMRQRGQMLEQGADARDVGGTLIRRIEPVQQVVARLELKGPDGLRAGVDVRGDGSSEAYTGRVRRRLVEVRAGEDAYAALGRVLGA
jgi:hypothetical protein